MRKSTKKLVLIFACLVLTAILSCVFSACNFSFNIVTPNINVGNVPKATSFVSVDINPSIEFVLDQNGRVISVAGANEDGQILLWQESGIQGADIDFAVKKILALAKKYGYLTQDNMDVDVAIFSTNEEMQDNIFTKIANAIDESEEIDVTLHRAVDFVNSTILNALTFENEKLAIITPSQYRVIRRVMQLDPSFEIEDALDMSNEQLLKHLQTLHSNSSAKLGDTFKATEREANYVYESSYALIVDSLYSQHFENKVQEAIGYRQALIYANKTTHGVRYSAFHAMEIALTHYHEMLRHYRTDYSIDNVAIIYDTFKEYTDISQEQLLSLLRNENGNIGAVQLDRFIDGLYRELEEDQIDDFKNSFASIASNLEKEQDMSISKGIENLLGKAQDILTTLPDLVASLVDDELKVITLPIIDFMDIDSVEEAIDFVVLQKQTSLDAMRANESDLLAISLAQIELASALEELKTNLENTITLAKERAYEYLDAQKGLRLVE